MLVEDKMNKDYYETARANPEIRQEFLDSIDMEEYAPFVGELGYRGVESEHTMYLEWHIFRPRKVKSPIIICNRAFDEAWDWESFYNTLLHHEGFHAKSFYLGSPHNLIDRVSNFFTKTFHLKNSRKFDLNRCLEEDRAYSNQIEHPSFLECSRNFQGAIIGSLEINRGKIRMLSNWRIDI